MAARLFEKALANGTGSVAVLLFAVLFRAVLSFAAKCLFFIQRIISPSHLLNTKTRQRSRVIMTNSVLHTVKYYSQGFHDHETEKNLKYSTV